ncbi:MAG: hypothetical protein JO235_02695 [Chroococcidiopsidaceae cyanobacterium CP_BM_RX_35]|nr:hypothetical protein [Chroococcidiopsidaceae cyanobacterium CP_BM_RX_35]
MANSTPSSFLADEQPDADRDNTDGKELDSSTSTSIPEHGEVARSERLPQKPKLQSWKASLLTIALLLCSAGLVTGGFWLSIQLIFNPDAIAWLNHSLPDWAQIPLVNQEQPQTLAQIRDQLNEMGNSSGDPIPLEIDPQTSQIESLVLPVLSSSSECENNCQQIVELRVYQQIFKSHGSQAQNGEPNYQLVNQLPIQGIEESFAIAPLLNADSGYQGSDNLLPLTELHQFEGITPGKGVWLYLKGQSVQRGKAIAYGYVLHYNLSHSHLSLILPWTSPTGQVPQWQQVTASDLPELVLDQTTELEPQIQVYQVKPAEFFLNPIQLEPISLAEPALHDPAYQNAILIAQSGLWSPAWKWLQYIKQQQRHNWSAAAQTQMDFIRLYAEQTQAQANQTWASPSQQVLAKLIDGRWGQGLQVFQASPENTQEIATLLKTDSGRLWHRVEVALRVNPQRPEVEAWGALIVAAQQGQKAALAWLQQQPQTTSATIAYIQPLIKRLDGQSSTPNNIKSHPSRLLGTVEPLAQVNPAQWLLANPGATLDLEAQQSWYQVKVDAFYDGKLWQRAPFTNLQLPKTTSTNMQNIAPALWQQLGLDTDAQIQIVIWQPDGQQETTIATVKAVQLHSGELRLLATSYEMLAPANPGSQPQPLALTEATLQWVQPEPITLTELSQQHPQTVAALLPVLWRELQKSGQLHLKAMPSFEQLQEQLEDWPVQLLNLTGNGKSAIVLTVSPEAIAALNNPESVELAQGSRRSYLRRSLELAAPPSNASRSHTIIFSDTGALLYSEFGTAAHQSVTAIADLKDGGSPALLVEAHKTYSLQRWSAQHQRFE